MLVGGHCIMLKKRGSYICLWGSLHNAEKTGVFYMFVLILYMFVVVLYILVVVLYMFVVFLCMFVVVLYMFVVVLYMFGLRRRLLVTGDG